MSNLLVNGLYPIDYFMLPGVEEVQYPDRFWWSSKQRFATTFPLSDVYAAPEEGGVPTSEILEIDLGRIRTINYINFDVIRAPIDIEIEYDVISTPDREAKWVKVVRKSDDDLPFDNVVFFDPRSKSAWFNAEFHFTTPRGNMVHTRYIRITFTRRNDQWPTTTSKPFKWPIFVKHLRVGRYIANYLDTVGPLLVQDTPPDLTEYNLPNDPFEEGYTREIRQQFRIPDNAARGDILPHILGFGILAEVKEPILELGAEPVHEVDIELEWSLWDVTIAGSPTRIIGGIHSGKYDVGINWINWYLNDQAAIKTGPHTKYEFRLRSLNKDAVSKLFLTQQRLSTTELPGTFNFTLNSTTVNTTKDMEIYLDSGEWISTPATTSILQVNTFVSPTQFTLVQPFPSPTASNQIAKQVYPSIKWGGSSYVEDATTNLVMRVWADVADEGKDVLGNTYRYGVRREKAEYVIDGTKAGWMSDPKPSKDAVESLYFDVRQINKDTGEKEYCLIDAIRISPRTPGVKMNIYYSKENLDGERPQTTEEWDYLLWQPVSQFSYQLRRNEVIVLPTTIRAAFVKLEFTDLNPLPWRVPNYPPLPPKLFRRFPTWVEEQFTNSQLRNVIEDWWLRKATPVQIQILNSIRDPILEFEYKEKEFLSALALGEIDQNQIINQNLVNVEDKAIIDPITGSKIYIHFGDQYKKSLLISVDQESALGKAVINRYDPYLYREQIEEDPPRIPREAIPTVSSINDRITQSYSHLTRIPMRFNKTARHVYREDIGEFNKKAYFVGIDEVEFLRDNYTIKFNDKVIKNLLYNDDLLEYNSWSREPGTNIPDGATLYVSYFNARYFEDEEITLHGFAPVKLIGSGGPLFNVRVFSLPQQRGIQYFENDDWVVSHVRNEKGILEHYIARSPHGERFAAPTQPLVFTDSYVVIGKAFIPNEPTYDEDTVIGVAAVSGEEGIYVPNYGTGLYGGGIYKDLRSTYADETNIVGVAVISAIENMQYDDSGTIVGVGVVTGEEEYIQG